MYKSLPFSMKGLRSRLLGGLLLTLVAGLSSCDLAVNDITAPTWQPNILAPIAQASLELEDFDDLAVISMSAYVDVNDLGLTPGIIQPGQNERRSGVTAGPYTIHWVEGVIGAEAGEGKLRLKIRNELPVGISQGAILRVVQASTGETVLEHAIGNDLPGFGRLSDSITVLDIAFASGLEFWIEEMELTPIQGEIIEPGSGFAIEAEVEFNNVRQARVSSGSSVLFTDTVPLTIDLAEDLGRYVAEGSLRLKVGNGFPFGGRLDASFLSKNAQNTLGTLTNETISINIPAIDAQGFALESAETDIVIPITEEQLRIMARSDFLGFSGEIYAPSSPSSVVANGDRSFDVQLIADLQFTVQP